MKLLCLSACALVLCAQTATELFEPTKLNDIRLTFAAGDWEKLRETYLEDTYYKVGFQWQAAKVGPVGVRSRGNGSRNSAKPGLKLDFSQYVKDQTFAGFKSLVLDNLVQDRSMMAERLSMELFRKMGIAAPRVAHVRVFVNDKFEGLYTIVEPVDKLFLKVHLGEDAGQLFDYDWASDYNFEYAGEDAANYAPVPFAPKTNEKNPDLKTLVEFIRTLNETTDDEFAGALTQFLDAEKYLNYLAVETFLADMDGQLGDWGMNNFYLYRRANSKQFVFIPWDKDVTFSSVNRSIWHNSDRNVLTRRLLAIPAYRDHFTRAMQRVMELAGGPGGWLDIEINRIKMQIQADAAIDATKPYPTSEFYDGVRDLYDFTRLRPQFARGELGVR
jgi:spore coat protein CotH